MLAADRPRALALAGLIIEDIAIAMDVPVTHVSQPFKDFAEAVGMFVFATGNLEKAATTGALVFTAARLP